MEVSPTTLTARFKIGVVPLAVDFAFVSYLWGWVLGLDYLPFRFTIFSYLGGVYNFFIPLGVGGGYNFSLPFGGGFTFFSYLWQVGSP